MVRSYAGPVRRRAAAARRPHLYKEHYVQKALDAVNSPTTYVEIGVRHGDSFRMVRADVKLAVDPVRSVKMGRLGSNEHFYEEASDEFFSTTAPGVIAPGAVGSALVDGLHVFDQALRDVLNLEPLMARGGVIVLDDCNPLDTRRAAPAPCEGLWNGDVWKVMAYMRAARRDLTCVTLNADQGIGLIFGFEGGGGVRDVDQDAATSVRALEYHDLASSRQSLIGLIEI